MGSWGVLLVENLNNITVLLLRGKRVRCQRQKGYAVHTSNTRGKGIDNLALENLAFKGAEDDDAEFDCTW